MYHLSPRSLTGKNKEGVPGYIASPVIVDTGRYGMCTSKKTSTLKHPTTKTDGWAGKETRLDGAGVKPCETATGARTYTVTFLSFTAVK